MEALSESIALKDTEASRDTVEKIDVPAMTNTLLELEAEAITEEEVKRDTQVQKDE